MCHLTALPDTLGDLEPVTRIPTPCLINTATTLRRSSSVYVEFV
jgi:hypothetical protein